jgi:hypothetical protein
MDKSGLSDDILNDTSGFPDDAPAETKETKAAPAVEEPEGNEPEGDEPEGEDHEGEEPSSEKPRKSVKARLDEVIRQRNEERSERRALEARLAALEANRQQIQQESPKPQATADAPDPSTYEYGALDDRYINDMIDFKAKQLISEHLASTSQQLQVNHAATVKMNKAREIVDKGAKVHDDFEEVVFQGGMRGDYRLDEPTFDALSEAENPHEIIYELANNPREAARVASMSPAQQAKYVFLKDAEFTQKAKAPRAPKAAPPPGSSTKGASGRFTVAGDTEDLDAFEKEFFAKKR